MASGGREQGVLTGHAESELVWELGKEALEEGALADTRRAGHEQRSEKVWEGRHGGGGNCWRAWGQTSGLEGMKSSAENKACRDSETRLEGAGEFCGK